MDNVGAAKHLGMGYSTFMHYRAENKEAFEEVDNEYLSLLESLVALSALGEEMPKAYENFDFAKAVKILERKKPDWMPSQRHVKPQQKEQPKVDWEKMIDEHVDKHGTAASAGLLPPNLTKQ